MLSGASINTENLHDLPESSSQHSMIYVLLSLHRYNTNPFMIDRVVLIAAQGIIHQPVAVGPLEKHVPDLSQNTDLDRITQTRTSRAHMSSQAAQHAVLHMAATRHSYLAASHAQPAALNADLGHLDRPSPALAGQRLQMLGYLVTARLAARACVQCSYAVGPARVVHARCLRYAGMPPAQQTPS